MNLQRHTLNLNVQNNEIHCVLGNSTMTGLLHDPAYTSITIQKAPIYVYMMYITS